MSELDSNNVEQLRNILSSNLLEMDKSLASAISQFICFLMFGCHDNFSLNESVWNDILRISSGNDKVPSISEEIRIVRAKIQKYREDLSSLESVEGYSSEEWKKQESFFEEELREINLLIVDLSKKAKDSYAKICLPEDPNLLDEKLLKGRRGRIKNNLNEFKKEFLPNWWT